MRPLAPFCASLGRPRGVKCLHIIAAAVFVGRGGKGDHVGGIGKSQDYDDIGDNEQQSVTSNPR